MAETLLLATFLSFVAVLGLFVIRLVARGINIFATPPINVPAFICAKICAFASCSFIPLAVLSHQPALRAPSGVSAWASLALLAAGAVIAAAAMKRLGDDLVFGLPGKDVGHLQTGGIYAISRNPLYLGFIMIIVASWIRVPHPLNLAAGAIAITLHHMIVVREEGFLAAARGVEFADYMKKVGRYLPGF